MAVASGGSGDLEGLAALISAVVVALGFVLSLFRAKAPSSDVKQEILHAVEEELLEARQTSLLERVADYDRQVRRVHQLTDYIVDHGLSVPERHADED